MITPVPTPWSCTGCAATPIVLVRTDRGRYCRTCLHPDAPAPGTTHRKLSYGEKAGQKRDNREEPR